MVYGKEFPGTPLSQPTAPIAFVRFNIYASFTSDVFTFPIASGDRAGWGYTVGGKDPLLLHPWSILDGCSSPTPCEVDQARFELILFGTRTLSSRAGSTTSGTRRCSQQHRLADWDDHLLEHIAFVRFNIYACYTSDVFTFIRLRMEAERARDMPPMAEILFYFILWSILTG